MKELKDTIELMQSNDFKDRVIAEYWQTKIRYNKLHRMIIKHDAGTLEFELNCPIDLLRGQAGVMGNYLEYLEIRAEIEKIDLGNE